MTNEEAVVCLVFCDSVKNPITEPKISASYVCSPHLDQLAIDVRGEIANLDLEVQGCIITKAPDGKMLTDDQCAWTNLACIQASILDVVQKIEDAGIYYVSLTGINRVRIKCNAISGSATIVGTGVR